MSKVLRVEYQNPEARGWIDFIRLDDLRSPGKREISYRAQWQGRWYAVRGLIEASDEYADLITDRAEAQRLDIYEGTVRFALRETENQISVDAILWAHPGKSFEPLSPPPISTLVVEETDDEIARSNRLGTITSRKKQGEFSAKMREAYNQTCAITGCKTPQALEAAHVRVQQGSDDNSYENGILLRADIHALFDAGLLALTPDGAKVEVSPHVTDASYRSLNGAAVARPRIGAPPSKENIRAHRERSWITL